MELESAEGNSASTQGGKTRYTALAADVGTIMLSHRNQNSTIDTKTMHHLQYVLNTVFGCDYYLSAY